MLEWLTISLHNRVPQMQEKGLYFGADVRTEVCRELNDLFVKVISKRKPPPPTRLTHWKKIWFYERLFRSNPTLMPFGVMMAWRCKLRRMHDLNVFFVPSQADSIIARVNQQHAPGDAAGLTSNTAEGVISEVYVEYNGPARKWAKIAFHELMHNKCDVGWGQNGENLHNFGGGGLAVKKGVTDLTPLTDANCRYLNQHLHRANRQYSAGEGLDPDEPARAT
jgi:hypothetical protein